MEIMVISRIIFVDSIFSSFGDRKPQKINDLYKSIKKKIQETWGLCVRFE